MNIKREPKIPQCLKGRLSLFRTYRFGIESSIDYICNCKDKMIVIDGIHISLTVIGYQSISLGSGIGPIG